MSALVFIGAGGFGLEVADYAQDARSAGLASFEPAGFLDDTKPVGSVHAGLPVLGDTNARVDPSALYLIAVGSPEGRRHLAQKLAAQGARFFTLRHPLAYVAPSATLGEGTVLAPFSFVGPEARIGAQAALNIYASVGHNAQLGDYAVLSPYAGLHGGASAGDGVFLGAHAGATAGVTLGAGCKLSAGAVAFTDIPAGVLALGNPARWRA